MIDTPLRAARFIQHAIACQSGRYLLLGPSASPRVLIARRIAAGKPFRAPHHTCSQKALVEESSLARGGTLLLDHVPEFRWHALSALAGTLDDVPMFIATSCLCPCGSHDCRCSGNARTNYWRRVAPIIKLFRLTVIDVDLMPEIDDGVSIDGHLAEPKAVLSV